MFTPPNAIVPILQPFSTLFQQRTWIKAQVLLAGTILAPRKRTVTSALRVMGLSDDDRLRKVSPRSQSRHLVIPAAEPSSADASDSAVLPSGDGPLVFGIDETIERQAGQSHQGKGHIPRRCALQQTAILVKGLRPALDKPDVADRHTLGA